MPLLSCVATGISAYPLLQPFRLYTERCRFQTVLGCRFTPNWGAAFKPYSGAALERIPQGDGHLATVSVLGPGTNLFGEVLHGVDPTVETLFRKGGKLNFCHIQPAGLLRCVDHLETL